MFHNLTHVFPRRGLGDALEEQIDLLYQSYPMGFALCRQPPGFWILDQIDNMFQNWLNGLAEQAGLGSAVLCWAGLTGRDRLGWVVCAWLGWAGLDAVMQQA